MYVADESERRGWGGGGREETAVERMGRVRTQSANKM